jgi:hypothetical protein
MTGIGLFTTFAPVSDRAQPPTFNRAGACDIRWGAASEIL